MVRIRTTTPLVRIGPPRPQASGYTPQETAGGPQGFANYPIFGLAGLRKTATFAECIQKA